MFVVFEGIDGSGTTSQVKLVSEILRSNGKKVHTTREPSDRPIGLFIRKVLCGKVDIDIGDKTMGLLFTADRSDHIEKEIKPALEDGCIVLCDRYYHSSLAYQSMNPGSAKYIYLINESMLVPDLTIILDITVPVSISRRSKRSHQDFTETRNFLLHSRAAYLDMVEYCTTSIPGKKVLIDADREIDLVTQEIVKEIYKVMG